MTGRFVLSVLLVGVLSGCAMLQREPEPDVLATTVRACLAHNKQFVDAWGCVQDKDLSDLLGTDLQRRKLVIKLGDDLASQVAAKKLSNAAALKRLEAQLSVGAPQ